MKIFSWVHRKFQNNVPKENSNFGYVKTTETRSKDSDTQALLREVAFVDLFDGWKDGILSIGTLGFDDPLKPLLDRRKDNLISESEEEEEDSEKCFSNEDDPRNDDPESADELNPLVVSISAGEDYEKDNPKSEIIEAIEHDGAEITGFETVPLTPCSLESDQKKKGERITLADLFLADSDGRKKSDPAIAFKNDVCRKTTLSGKNGKSLAKKLIGRGGENSQPIKKFNQFVKRMLKRKIHPELGDKGENTDANARPSVLKLTGKESEVSDSTSLLQTQGAIVSPEL